MNFRYSPSWLPSPPMISFVFFCRSTSLKRGQKQWLFQETGSKVVNSSKLNKVATGSLHLATIIVIMYKQFFTNRSLASLAFCLAKNAVSFRKSFLAAFLSRLTLWRSLSISSFSRLPTLFFWNGSKLKKKIQSYRLMSIKTLRRNLELRKYFSIWKDVLRLRIYHFTKQPLLNV